MIYIILILIMAAIGLLWCYDRLHTMYADWKEERELNKREDW